MIPVGLLIRIGLALALAAALAFLYHAVAQHFREQGRVEIQTKWDADKAVRNKAIADQTLLWDAQRQKTDAAITERDKARMEAFDAIAKRSTLPLAVASQHVPAAFVGVLRDNASAANAAGAAGKPDETPAAPAASADAESDLGLLAGWFADVARIHAECRDRVAEWADFYAGLRAAQPEIQP